MDSQQAVDNLRALAAGVDPGSGVPLAEDHPLQRPELIRTFYTLLGLFDGPQGSARRRAANAGRAWSETDDEALRAACREVSSVRDLMERFGRSRNAIVARLQKLELEAPAGDEVGPAP